MVKVYRFTNALSLIDIELAGNQIQLRIVPHDDRVSPRIAKATTLEDALNQVFIAGELNSLPFQCSCLFTREEK